MGRVKTKIMGVSVDQITFADTNRQVSNFLENKGVSHIVTPNSEFVLQARSDHNFKQVLNNADLAVPDGSGVIIASWFTRNKLSQKIPGSDLVKSILKESLRQKKRVLVLNIAEGLSSSSEIEKTLRQKYPGLLVSALSVPAVSVFSDWLPAKVTKIEPEVLFVSFGSPDQDFWISRYSPKIPSLRLAMGVGGSFDFMTGKRKRAPKAFQKIGLEWLYRLFSKPTSGEYHAGKRFKKIFRSVVIFPILFVFTFNKD